MTMEIKTYYKKLTDCILHYFRSDLQLHFLWSFFLTMFAIFWLPFIWLGIIATIIKEGLDFKHIRQMYIMDPWYNISDHEQKIGRAIRFCSHVNLKPEEINVEIEDVEIVKENVLFKTPGRLN